MNRTGNENTGTILNFNVVDPYKILGISENASSDEISKAYKTLAKQYHPDLHSYKKETAEFKEIVILFTKITRAFNLLKDPDERKRFDHERKFMLAKQNVKPPPPPPAVNGINIKETTQGLNINTLLNDSERELIKKHQAESFYDSAVNEYNKGNFDAAIRNIQSALRINQKEAKYHSQLGLAFKAKGWNEYSQAEFKFALNNDPLDKIALENYKYPVKKAPVDNKIEKKFGSGVINFLSNSLF